jgi:hypothetical protein
MSNRQNATRRSSQSKANSPLRGGLLGFDFQPAVGGQQVHRQTILPNLYNLEAAANGIIFGSTFQQPGTWNLEP